MWPNPGIKRDCLFKKAECSDESKTWLFRNRKPLILIRSKLCMLDSLSLPVGFGQMDFITLNRSSKTKTLRVLIRAYVWELMRMWKKASKQARKDYSWVVNLEETENKPFEGYSLILFERLTPFWVVCTRHSGITLDHEISRLLFNVCVYVHLLMLR